ncbi:hypothetical protein CHS0354_004974 [Potamilus streckersoni]|uniref:Uncharacterized protein n=1 Tax=Potamilus streckersoni TaxID=2493646 RepID=A0AAE0SSI7_9BIVA|nr:hypothetical protein CHS0354_004974 [Potamilus streckersoni]
MVSERIQQRTEVTVTTVKVYNSVPGIRSMTHTETVRGVSFSTRVILRTERFTESYDTGSCQTQSLTQGEHPAGNRLRFRVLFMQIHTSPKSETATLTCVRGGNIP